MPEQHVTKNAWPKELRGVDTGHMDQATWDWLQRMKATSADLVFKGQTFFITGGASGIGEKLCVFAAELGAKAVTLDLPKSIDAKNFDGQDIIGIGCDISNYDDVKRLVDGIGKQYGITKVVLNAGIFPNPRPQPTEFDMQTFEAVMRINTFGNTQVCDAALPYLWSEQNKGKDPLVAIVGSRNLGTPSHPSYTMAKAAMAQYGFYLANIDSPKGQPRHRVFQIHPDAVFDTNVWGATPEEKQQALEDSAAKKGLTVEEYLDKSNPMGMQFTSWNVAASIMDLSLPIHRGMHGVGIHSNGGVHIPKPY